MSTKFLGHYLHPMLVVFPLGLFITSLAFDLICLASGNPQFGVAAYWMIVAGIVGAVAAAPFGTIDWAGIPSGTRAKRVGLMHGLAGGVMLALFVICWLLRGMAPAQPTALSIALSIAGVTSATIGGWLGGELVERLGIGVHPDADSDAPRSLSGRDARQSASAGPQRDRFFGGPKPAH
jgi:uncharacterized membrane protein